MARNTYTTLVMTVQENVMYLDAIKVERAILPSQKCQKDIASLVRQDFSNGEGARVAAVIVDYRMARCLFAEGVFGLPEASKATICKIDTHQFDTTYRVINAIMIPEITLLKGSANELRLKLIIANLKQEDYAATVDANLNII